TVGLSQFPDSFQLVVIASELADSFPVHPADGEHQCGGLAESGIFVSDIEPAARPSSDVAVPRAVDDATSPDYLPASLIVNYHPLDRFIGNHGFMEETVVQQAAIRFHGHLLED